MEVIFTDKKLQRLFETGKETGKPKYPKEAIRGFIKSVKRIQFAPTSAHLTNIHGLGFEKMTKEYKGLYAVRANDRYRVIFSLIKSDNGIRAEIAAIEELTDYH